MKAILERCSLSRDRSIELPNSTSRSSRLDGPDMTRCCITRRSVEVICRLSAPQSLTTDSSHTTTTRSGNPCGRRGSRKIVSCSPGLGFTTRVFRNQSSKSCSGPGRALRNAMPLVSGFVIESTIVIVNPPNRSYDAVEGSASELLKANWRCVLIVTCAVADVASLLSYWDFCSATLVRG